jgi:hypothetical protein
MNKECSNGTMFKQIARINLGRTDEMAVQLKCKGSITSQLLLETLFYYL